MGLVDDSIECMGYLPASFTYIVCSIAIVRNWTSGAVWCCCTDLTVPVCAKAPDQVVDFYSRHTGLLRQLRHLRIYFTGCRRRILSGPHPISSQEPPKMRVRFCAINANIPQVFPRQSLAEHLDFIRRRSFRQLLPDYIRLL